MIETRIRRLLPARSTMPFAWQRVLGAVLACVIAVCVSLPARAGNPGAGRIEIELVLSDGTSLYADAAQELKKGLAADVSVVSVLAEAVERRARPGTASAIVTLGTRALTAVLAQEARVPVIAALVPRKAFDSAVAAAPGSQVSAVFLDQPYARQLNLIRLVLPTRPRVGVLAGPEWDVQISQLANTARDQRITLVRETVNTPKDLHPALQRILGEADSILALPDSNVFNATTLPNVLLTTYRNQQPVFGFSPAYVRAGALAAVFSTPQQNARQAAEMLQRTLSSGVLPQPQYPRTFWVSVNPTVARSLDLKVQEEAALVAELQKLERE
ncbi:MAG TPA: ABC transporter substrate binding protein [Rhodocyclaceae bacterium]|nr:hypothetical protein [Rhodocyclaceae bacterium]HMZ82855.1 ABC transporter substrate binding protein [Rhodocyclaceae bacterium]HNA02781.1 ABC transporter substrate binding protein [Rhodocyclaceae bacterium]HNB78337.1 ABC transporter substrate binding protein [Rhodocyclaceae bacterium]HNC60693.1 ABC transporter substrate binding protein [Rhodocyclaceae bacterium]